MFRFAETQLPYKIILGDSDEQQLNELTAELSKFGFEVKNATNGDELIDLAKKNPPDIILADIILPSTDGVETIRTLKEQELLKNILFVIYSARTEDYSIEAAFNAGADDYIFKPAKPRIIALRLKALLKRINAGSKQAAVLGSNELKVDLERFTVRKQGRQIVLTKKEMKILSLLATKPGKVFPREKIIEEIWGAAVSATDRRIDVHIRRLREKIGEKFITTIKGIGYRLELNNKIEITKTKQDK